MESLVMEKVADWSIQEIWNELVTEDRPIESRDYIRASEIGKPFLDRYLLMKGVQPTNPFPARVKRIFDAGLIYEIDVVERIFRLLGILQEAQKEVIYQPEGMLKIIGHFDHKVGGKINKEMAMLQINNPLTSAWMAQRATKLLDQLLIRYPDGLKTLIAEIKTVNSMAFWSHKNIDPQTGFFRGYDHHKLQLFTYLLAENEAEGRLFYISKDDLTLLESPVSRNNIVLKEVWENDISQMTKYYREDIEPEKPIDIIFNERKGIWEVNWMVARSPYFTMITGKETVDDWRASLYGELKTKNSDNCKNCGNSYSLTTLNKNSGFCARCAKKGGVNNGKSME